MNLESAEWLISALLVYQRPVTPDSNRRRRAASAQRTRDRASTGRARVR